MPTPPDSTHRSRRTLLRSLWPFTAGMLAMLCVGLLSLSVLSALRTFGEGEALWTKVRQTATLRLMSYAQTGQPQFLAQFDASLHHLQHFSAVREAMLATPPRYDDMHASMQQLGLASDDADEAIWLYRFFGRTDFFAELAQVWAQADRMLVDMAPLRAQIEAAYATGEVTLEQRIALAGRVDAIDRRGTPLQQRFSQTLTNTWRQVEHILKIAEVALAALLIAGIGWGTVRLLRQRQRALERLNSERKRAAITLASIGDAVVSADAQGRLSYMNQAAQRLLQISAKAGAPLNALFTLIDETRGDKRAPLSQAVLSGRVGSEKGAGEQTLLRADGSRVPVSWVATPLRERADGPVDGAVLVLRENSAEHSLIERLQWLAAHDPMTLLPNRPSFEARLERALDALRRRAERDGPHRSGDAQHVLMLIDLDQFKIINDTCGHAVGDQLMRLLAEKLAGQLREGDMLARMGGDEFGLLLVDCPAAAGEARAEGLRRAVTEVGVDWSARRFSTTASIGVVHLDHPQAQAAEVLSQVDVACYTAKDSGRNRVVVYKRDDPHMARRFGEMDWAQRLQAALQQNRFVLYAQTVVGLQPHSQGQSRCELLLRMRDEEGKIVPPGLFMPAAERFGLMPLLDRWVVENALARIAELEAAAQVAALAGAPAQRRFDTYAINLSGGSFGDSDFLDLIKRAFRRSGVAHSRVCFEITESQAVANLAQATRFINELRALGCSFALDDFGSGMSSFAYLKHLSIDMLKIDGSLVKDMVRDPVDRAMVRTIQSLAQALGIRTVGEYAEDAAIIEALRDCGVDYAQGYGIDKPQPLMAPPAAAAAATQPAVAAPIAG